MAETVQIPVPGCMYLLPTSEDERQRLQTQHIWLKRTAYNNRLTGKVNLDPDSHVLDVGAGTGTWVMDLASEVPQSVRMYAIDVSTKGFPKGLPPNIAFIKMPATILSPVWTDKFAFVHQRLLISALRVSEWPVVVSEIFRVLRPGGAAQFVEVSSDGWWTETAASKKNYDLIAALHKEGGLMFDCGAQLPRLLRDAGFVDIRVEAKVAPLGRGAGADGERGTRAAGGAFRGMKASVLRARGLGFVRSEREHDELMHALEAEWDEGKAKPFPITFVYAQKPSQP